MRQSDPVLNGLHRDLYEDEKGRFFLPPQGDSRVSISYIDDSFEHDTAL